MFYVALKKRLRENNDYYQVFSIKHMFYVALKKRLRETVLLSTHNICFG